MKNFTPVFIGLILASLGIQQRNVFKLINRYFRKTEVKRAWYISKFKLGLSAFKNVHVS